MGGEQKALEIIKKYEGLRLEAYLCPAGKPTIGWGHTHGVKLGQKISACATEIFCPSLTP